MNRDNGSDEELHPRERFAKRVGEYLKRLLAFVIRLTQDRELAQDIAQQTISNYLDFREAHNWKPEIKNEGAYLLRIARNLLNDRWKKLSKNKPVSLDQQLSDELLKEINENTEPVDLDKQVYLEELHRTIPLKTVLVELSDTQKRLLWLRYVEELTFEEIGTIVNENPIVVRYELQKIRTTVRARVKRMFGTTSLFRAGS